MKMSDDPRITFTAEDYYLHPVYAKESLQGGIARIIMPSFDYHEPHLPEWEKHGNRQREQAIKKADSIIAAFTAKLLSDDVVENMCANLGWLYDPLVVKQAISAAIERAK